ncbi:hypothetical protein [Azospirillum sp. sgz302134]
MTDKRTWFAAGLRLLAVAALAVAVSACSIGQGTSRNFPGDQAGVLPSGATVAVLPFENLTTHQNAGMIASELVSTELYRLNRVRVVEASRVRNRLIAAKVDVEKLTESTYAQEVGRTLGVDAVLIGSVTEYGYQHGLREEPVVGINARLVRAADGAVLWASSQSQVGRGYFARDSVNNLAQRVVVRMLDGLRAAMAVGT